MPASIPDELTSTGEVIASVASNPNAIGYASLSAVDDTVKAVTVGGVEATEATVLDGTYAIQRNFNFILNSDRPSPTRPRRSWTSPPPPMPPTSSPGLAPCPWPKSYIPSLPQRLSPGIRREGLSGRIPDLTDRKVDPSLWMNP